MAITLATSEFQESFLALAVHCPYGEGIQTAIETWAQGRPGTTWEALEAQVREQAHRHSTTPEKFLDELFGQPSKELFLKLLGIGGC